MQVLWCIGSTEDLRARDTSTVSSHDHQRHGNTSFLGRTAVNRQPANVQNTNIWVRLGYRHGRAENLLHAAVGDVSDSNNTVPVPLWAMGVTCTEAGVGNHIPSDSQEYKGSTVFRFISVNG